VLFSETIFVVRLKCGSVSELACSPMVEKSGGTLPAS
jgi:hypothetical protein